VEQVRDPFLLDGLRGIVRGPILAVRYTHRLFDRSIAVGLHRTANRIFDSVQVLALDSPRLEVRARTVRPLRSGLDDVGSVAGLRGDDPQDTLLLDGLTLGDGNSALFSRFHTSILLQDIYAVNPRGSHLTYIPIRYSIVLCRKSAYGDTAASGASTNGCLGTRTRSRWSVQSVRVHTGTLPAERSVRWAALAASRMKNLVWTHFEMRPLPRP
jgi:hypothetical protein